MSEFSAAEKAAMKERAKERAGGRTYEQEAIGG